MVKKGIRYTHCGSEEGYKDREGDHKKNQIDGSGDEANREASVRPSDNRQVAALS